MPRRVWLTSSAVALLLVDLAAQAPPAAERTAAISGIVFDGSTRQPVPQAVVTLGVFGASPWPAWQGGQLTDDRGRFAFVDLPPGAYALVAQKTGYQPGVFAGAGLRDPSSVPIRLRAGEWFSNANLSLARTGSLSGTVRDESGEPVVGVFVQALARVPVAGVLRLAPGPLTETDDRGVYRLGNLRPGQYAVLVPSVVTALPAATDPLSLPGMPRLPSDAAPRAGGEIPSSNPLVEIDSGTRLMLRGYPIPPPPNPRPLAYPMAFAGGGWGGQAAVYSITAGSHLTGADVVLTPTAAVRISGQVEGPADARTNLTLRLLPDGLDDLGAGGEAATTLVAADGSFVFGPVPSGTYVIEAAVSVNSYRMLSDDGTDMFYAPAVPRSPGETGVFTITEPIGAAPAGIGFTTARRRAKSHWARTRISAGPDGAANVIVALQSTRTVHGRLVVSAAAGGPSRVSIPRSVRLESADGSPAHGIATSGVISSTDGAFTISGILPGRYVVRADSQPWIIRSVLVGGRDHTQTPIEVGDGDVADVVVTVTSETASVSGTVRDVAGLVADDAGVVVFPAEPEQWIDYGLNPRRIATARTSTEGAFRVSALPAGNYQIVAVPADRLDAWRQPGFFRSVLPRAERVTLTWGEERIVDVRLQGPQ